MEILRSLGVDSTLFIHLVCFLVSYIALTQLVLKPYMAAYREREKRTIGNEEAATQLLEQGADLQAEYETKAKALNAEIKKIYDQARTEATGQYDKLVQTARAQASDVVTKNRADLKNEVQAARNSLSAEIPAVSAAIASKLAGKEITA